MATDPTSSTPARLEVSDSGVFLALGGEGESSAERWAALSSRSEAWAAVGALPGVRLDECKLLPMRVDPSWGEDRGPHFSVVTLPGKGTGDLDGTPDPFKEVAGPGGKTVKVLSDELRAKADALAGKVWELDLSSMQVSYLLGAQSNDDITNGPVMVTAEHEAARPVLNDVRRQLGLKAFPPAGQHSVHTTLCKVTGADGDHAAFRKRLTGWPRPEGSRFPKPLASLAEALDQ